jgi:hypothetical protein
MITFYILVKKHAGFYGIFKQISAEKNNLAGMMTPAKVVMATQ